MAKKEYTGYLSVNDGLVFVDSGGAISERIGIAYYEDEDENKDLVFIDEYGYRCELACNSPFECVLGHKGDTLKLADLGVAYCYAEEPADVLHEAQRYFTINTEGIEDTVVLMCHNFYEHYANIYSPTKSFPLYGGFRIDLMAEDYDYRDERIGIDDTLIPILVAYSDIIGKRVNVEVYFEKETSGWETDEHLKEENKEIYRLEEMFLPRLRRHINENFNQLWEEHSSSHVREQEYKEKRAENKERFASKYDKEPNLY